MEALKLFLSFINLLLLPTLIWISNIDRRLARLEGFLLGERTTLKDIADVAKDE